MSDQMQTIEINGVKMEVDMRYAKRIDIFKIGSKVKILLKASSAGYEDKVRSGVIVGFEPFKGLPTIVVCYLEIDYNGARIQFAYVNEKTGDKFELVASIDDDLPISKTDVLAKLDKEIEDFEGKAKEVRQRRAYFLSHFNQYFEEAVAK